jgi:2'-5' RNA ligase
MRPIRAFIAIDLDRRLKRELAHIQDRLKQAKANIKWVEPENFHLTLNFLGDIHPTKVDDIEQAIKRVAASFTAFHMDIGELGVFPDARSPRVIWAGVTKRANLIAEMAEKLSQELAGLDIIRKDDIPFSPHITLGRLKTPPGDHRLEELLTGTHIPSGLSQKVEQITLFRSDLLPDGARYDIVSLAHLRS